VRLVVDVQACQSLDHAERGIAQYAAGLTRGLIRRGADIVLFGLDPELPFPRSLPPELLGSVRVAWATRGGILSAVGRLAPSEVAWIVASPVEEVPVHGILPAHVRDHGALVVPVVHDVIPLLQPERYLADEWALALYRQRLSVYRCADLVLANSVCSREDLVAIAAVDRRRVAVVYGGVRDGFGLPDRRAQPVAGPPLPGVADRFVLCVGGDDPRKNLDGLVRAWRLVPERVRAERTLVIACSLGTGSVAHLRDVAAEARLPWGGGPGGVLVTGFVDDDVLRRLYRDAELSVTPSTYEGLGLMVIEALASGCPTVTSCTSSLPEVLDLPPATFDPHDPASMAACIANALVDEGLRSAILRRAAERLPRYTWEATADRTLAALEQVVRRGGPTRRRRGPRRPRVALVSPVPPSSSGPAVYTGRLVGPLRPHADVILVDAEGHRTERLGGARCTPLSEVGRGAFGWSEFDHVVTVVGNSEQYWAAVQQLRRMPSVAWLHEARLAAVITERARALGLADEVAGAWVRAHAERLYGGPAPALGVEAGSGRLPRLDDLAWADPGVLSSNGLGLTGFVVERASGVVVQSELALRLLELDLPPGGRRPPVAVLPLACIDPRWLPAPDPQDPPLLVALGIHHPKKMPDVLIGALALLRRDLDVRLAFVGPDLGGWREYLRKLGAEFGVADAVTVTGEVDEAAYWGWMRRASVAVQLRRGTYGESSGAVLELMAAGVPCVTSVATAAELPPGCVDLVDQRIDASGLADVLRPLLVDRLAREIRSATARAAAATWTFEHLAAALVPALESLAEGRDVHMARSASSVA